MAKLASIFFCLVIAMVTICTVQSAPSHRGHSSNLNSLHQSKRSTTGWVETDQKCRQFRCKEPQNRTYHMMDLLHETKLSPQTENFQITPQYLVIQRCDGHAGCCGTPGHTCAADSDKTEHEKIGFLIKKANEKAFVRFYTVEKHTSCSCQAVNKTMREENNRRLPNITCISDC